MDRSSDVTTIIVGLRQQGMHCWPDAPKELFFLADPHVHNFRIRAEVYVSHGEREHEFYLLRNDMELCLVTLYPDVVLDTFMAFGDHSCETIAKLLKSRLEEREYIGVSVEVWEDEEQGARIEAAHRHVTQMVEN